MKQQYFEFDVALSFAEEDRKIVDCVAKRLKNAGVKIYYDKYQEVDQWGMNLYDHLADVYQDKARYTIIFVSKNYKIKSWTQLERINAQARALTEKDEYILPFRLDDTQIPGLPSTISYLTKKSYSCQRLAEAIVQKVNKTPSSIQADVNNGSDFKTKIRNILPLKAVLTVGFIIIAAFTTAELRDRFTPASSLANRIHERSKHVIKGSMCRDGTFSFSTGRGTCSHHGGIMELYDSIRYDKTMAECRQEAKAISWISE